MSRRLKNPQKAKPTKAKKPVKKSQKTARARNNSRNRAQKEAKKPKFKIISENANNYDAAEKWVESEQALLDFFGKQNAMAKAIWAKLQILLKEKEPDLKKLKIYADVLGESGDRVKELIAEAKKYGFWGTEEDNTEKILREERLKLFAKRNHKLETTDPYQQ